MNLLFGFTDNTLLCGRNITADNWYQPNVIAVKGVSNSLIENPAPQRAVNFYVDVIFNDVILNTTKIGSTMVRYFVFYPIFPIFC